MMENNPRILIVDDELDFAQALQATLETKSYQVVTASNRSQAEAFWLSMPGERKNSSRGGGGTRG